MDEEFLDVERQMLFLEPTTQTNNAATTLATTDDNLHHMVKVGDAMVMTSKPRANHKR